MFLNDINLTLPILVFISTITTEMVETQTGKATHKNNPGREPSLCVLYEAVALEQACAWWIPQIVISLATIHISNERLDLPSPG